MKKLLLALMAASAALNLGAYEILDGTIEKSEVYPGTRHTFKVSVPEGYDPAKPAAMYLGFDGILYNAPEVIDLLIATGDIPPMVGIYLQPGYLTVADGKVVDYNRSNEFDAIDGRMGSFIENELLPAVRAMKTSSGQPITFSDDPDAHAISGASSGGIAAFVAAWNRPDLFHRVYTTCGTYVAMRGGDLLPALVRKTEPKPLRLVIHDGSRDAWNPLFGHWYEQNRLLASSLEFAGYDLKTVWDDGTHSIRNGHILFPEAMKFLWRDYPQKVTPGQTQNNCLTVLLDGATGWEQEPAAVTAAPLSVKYPDGSFFVETEPGSSWLYAYFTDSENNKTNRRKAYLLHDTSFADPEVTGMTYDTEGNLYVATHDGIQVVDQNGRVRAILPYPVQGKHSQFAFTGNRLHICLDGKWYSRTINATAVAPDAAPTEVKSQGAS